MIDRGRTRRMWLGINHRDNPHPCRDQKQSACKHRMNGESLTKVRFAATSLLDACIQDY